VGSYEGTFNITEAGAVTFSVVPEPSSFLLLSVGAMATAGLTRFRRKAAAAQA
jgi:hypothetical protein